MSPNSSRPLAVLASSSAMMKRTARLKVLDEQPTTAAQINTGIERAQKDADDPTTPVDSKKSTARGRDYTTLTLSRLFAGDATLPSSRTPSYNQAAGPLYLRSSEAVSLPDHLYMRGLLEGRHSDITVIAFGQRYALHRLILDRAPFFTTALSEPWIESQSKEVALHPEEIDTSITRAAFELAIKKLYGCDIAKEGDTEAIGLFATGCWLEMQDMIDASIESILRQMSLETLSPLIRLVTTNYYGRPGDRILASAKSMLHRNGWEMPLRYWDGIPGDIIREIVAGDGFFVNSEWDRWVLAKRLLDRRLREAAIDAELMEPGQRPTPKAPDSMGLMALRFDSVYRQNFLTVSQPMPDSHARWFALYTNPDIERILVLLDEGIHYIHMEYEQLDFIRAARDVFGLLVMPERVISSALWQQLALRQRVLNADEKDQELGLSQIMPELMTTVTMTKTQGRAFANGERKASVYTPDKESEMESGSWDGNGKPRKFWIPSTDCNIVLGNGAEPVVTTSNSFQRHANRLSATIQPEDAQWATDFASTPSTIANPNTRADHPARPVSASGSNAGQPKPMAYTEFPPFRFSAEFPNPRFLKEKKRVYSRTVSYAGSLWNIYIQKVRSAKNVQLGVYLHRAKEREIDETTPSSTLSQRNVGSVDERIGQLEREMLLRSERRERRRSSRVPTTDQTGEEDTSGSGGDVDATLVSTGLRNPLFTTSSLGRRRKADRFPRPASNVIHNFSSSPQFQHFQSLSTSPPADLGVVESPPYHLALLSPSEHPSDDSDDEGPETAYPNPSLSFPVPRKSRAAIATLSPYVDGRPTIKTYFKIYSPSKGGRMLSIYESAPDRFNFSQSWGWKSSTLMLDEIVLNGNGSEETAMGEGEGAARRKLGDGKLRFMVVIGNL
ncbi:uncharacterized protein BDR25DRAFT_220715 [Lindgomyces ingoldianus]|uniref:Uncharacterized protein n=1 Tax=Lindgomyces ingoldianus TaxID=673940 RepID=A0ACB6R265_9PLEO|nr:uncharacterized protein BDR25DRAFT_220715 [Lindgomyces ingoldianus]KAF2472536.1 hypothetical protein BDR25DRAFT_220715 [Lindgomyces ingoldianus]